MEVIEITIRLRRDYDPTTTYRAPLLPFDAIRREQNKKAQLSLTNPRDACEKFARFT